MITEQDVRDALRGERAATLLLHRELRPIFVQVARRVLWTPRGRSCPSGLGVEDLVQESFAGLFEREGRVLKMWKQDLGLSLQSFCWNHAWNRARTVLREHVRKHRSTPVTEEVLLAMPGECAADTRIADRDQLFRLLKRLRREYGEEQVQLYLHCLLNGYPGQGGPGAQQDTNRTRLYKRISRFVSRAREIRAEMGDPEGG